jgi:outer membrane protein TolC
VDSLDRLFRGSASADVPAVTLEDAAASARQHASGVEIAEAQRDAAAARHDQTAASRLPTLGVNGAVSVYTAPYEANFFTSVAPRRSIARAASSSRTSATSSRHSSTTSRRRSRSTSR